MICVFDKRYLQSLSANAERPEFTLKIVLARKIKCTPAITFIQIYLV